MISPSKLDKFHKMLGNEEECLNFRISLLTTTRILHFQPHLLLHVGAENSEVQSTKTVEVQEIDPADKKLKRSRRLLQCVEGRLCLRGFPRPMHDGWQA